MSVRQAQLALITLAGLNKLRIALQLANGGKAALTCLLQRVAVFLVPFIGAELDVLVGDGAQGFDAPVLDLKKQQAARRMQDDEVGIAPLSPQRNVIPDKIVLFQGSSSHHVDLA